MMTLVAMVLLLACGDLVDPPDEARQSFSSGSQGWAEFQALASNDPTDLGPAYTVKALVLDATTSKPQIWFIPKRYSLHWEFARDLDRKRFATRDAFDAQVYHDPAHPHAALTLTWYKGLTVASENLPPEAIHPITLTFFPSDNVRDDLVHAAYQRVLAAMPMVPRQGRQDRLAYVPATALLQSMVDLAPAKWAKAGVAWLRLTELYAGVELQAMNPGVAYGTLRAVPAGKLAQAAVSYRDILVLDRLPLDLPPVAGTITEELQTPLAHVNVAAKTRKTPNLALLGALTDARVQPLLGRPVRFEVYKGGFSLKEVPAAEVDAWWKQKLSGPTWHPQADLTVQGVHDMASENLGFAASKAFGFKAANYAELHLLWKQYAGEVAKWQTLPDGQATFTTGSLAVPFAEYEHHLLAAQVTETTCEAAKVACHGEDDQTADGCDRAAQVCKEVVAGKPANLKAYIAAVLDRPDFAADSALRASLLHGFRHVIETTPVEAKFGKELDAAIYLRFFSDGVRLRSSTNAEDVPGFTGAGLYDSFTAYASGPKRASLRIRKTWASVWSWRAFEERSLWKIAHLDVRMAVQINQAYPAEIANGVLVTKNLADVGAWGYYVNVQKGEASVTNPEGGITPEVLVLHWHGDPVQVDASTLQWSSLSPGEPLLHPKDLDRLVRAMFWAHPHFAALYGKTTDQMHFEVEFKIHDEARNLYVKQIRPF